ncbi:hypothetical protein HaLaN_15247 [Haematococcus lacustris]|uniref:Uncharacterized protein n=1 Tax=Haematococcus lacustris TaxID=44745 RepID=A0A699ZGA1_HAELA|nr:hypothetical protein HaLaN_15247 [Haematococcus lacustris]
MIDQLQGVRWFTAQTELGNLDSTWNDSQGPDIPGRMVHSPLCRWDNHRHLATQSRQSNILSEGDAGELQGDACAVLLGHLNPAGALPPLHVPAQTQQQQQHLAHAHCSTPPPAVPTCLPLAAHRARGAGLHASPPAAFLRAAQRLDISQSAWRGAHSASSSVNSARGGDKNDTAAGATAGLTCCQTDVLELALGGKGAGHCSTSTGTRHSEAPATMPHVGLHIQPPGGRPSAPALRWWTWRSAARQADTGRQCLQGDGWPPVIYPPCAMRRLGWWHTLACGVRVLKQAGPHCLVQSAAGGMSLLTLLGGVGIHPGDGIDQVHHTLVAQAALQTDTQQCPPWLMHQVM